VKIELALAIFVLFLGFVLCGLCIVLVEVGIGW
jgi:hypothetical protein